MKRNRSRRTDTHISVSHESSSRSESPDSVAFMRSQPGASGLSMPGTAHVYAVNSDPNHFTFEKLLSIISPPPELLPTAWKSGFDLHTRTVFFYKVDLEEDTLRITKSIRVRCREPLSKNGKPLLIPSLYIGDQKLHPSCAIIILGHEEIRAEEDLMKLLQHVDFCPKTMVSCDEIPVPRPVARSENWVPEGNPGLYGKCYKLEPQQAREIPMVIDVEKAEVTENHQGCSKSPNSGSDGEPVNLERKLVEDTELMRLHSELPRSGLPYPHSCANCHVDSTTLWRRDKNGNPVCNACGLYYRMYGVSRPVEMRKDSIRTRTPKQRNDAASRDPSLVDLLIERRPRKKRLTGSQNEMVCSNCQTRGTVLWRRNVEGHRVCNPCALYAKLHGTVRPAALWREEILTRRQRQRGVLPKKSAAAKRGGFTLQNENSNENGSPHFSNGSYDHRMATVTLASMVLDSPDIYVKEESDPFRPVALRESPPETLSVDE